MGLDTAEPRQCAHALVVAAAAGAAECDHCVGFVARQRFMQVGQLTVYSCTGFTDEARQHGKAGIDQRRRCGAAARDPDVRLAHAQFGKARRRSNRTIDVAQTFAATTQDRLRGGVAAGKQDALPGDDGRDHLDPFAALRNGIERCHRIRSAWQRIARFDPLRQRWKRRRRIGSGIGS